MRPSTVANCIFVFSGFLVVIYNEHFEFAYHHGNQWSTALQSLPADPDGDAVRILFAADPQLQGSGDRRPLLLGPFVRWDVDRYLAKYFRSAMSAVRPDVVVFMGDLMDNGSLLEDADEYSEYAERFRGMFPVPDGVLPIFIAGDNDIGGGEGHIVKPERVKQFESHFAPINEIVQYKHIRFYKIDFLPYVNAVPEPKLDNRLQRLLTEFSSTKPQEGETRLLLSHRAISDIMLHRHITIMQSLHPSYAFSAHSHYSGFVVHDLQKLMKFFSNIVVGPNKGKDVDPRGNIKMEEYKVPTCNYRLGVPSTAYGVASINTAGELHYALLWLPSRFRQLRLYLFYTVAAGLYLLWKWCRRRRSLRKIPYR